MHGATLDAVFSALSDPTRRAMIERLTRGAASISEISAGSTLTQPAISKHVKILESAGLLERTVFGRTHLCTLNVEAVAAASAWCQKQQRFWNAAFDGLEAHLRAQAAPTTARPTAKSVRKKT